MRYGRAAMATDQGGIASLRPAEFCALERQLVTRMAMRKKRNVEMGPVQEIKIQLLEHVQSADPDPRLFSAALAEAVIAVSEGGGTGPAQAVASDLQMDWDLACSSPGFVVWLRTAARDPSLSQPSPPPSPIGKGS
jgi:hypothetical protein